MLKFLLLCNRPAKGTNADTIIDHIDAIRSMPNVEVVEVSMLGHIPERLKLDRFDAIGVHYTLHISDPNDHFLSDRSIDRIAKFQGPKYIWMHDEYRRVDETIVKLKRMGIGTIFTVIPEDVAAEIYSEKRLPDTTIKTVLTGYVSQELKNRASPPIESRELDFVYRARRPPYWLGSFAMDKINIGLDFQDKAAGDDVRIDISVEEWDRKYSREWLDFLSSSKAALTVESGSSIVDFTGEVESSVEGYLAENQQATFDDVRFLIDPVDEKYSIKCVSPRVFEIAACKTLIVATPGIYSGVIIPWIHYVPLEKDLSNYEEVVDFVRNNQEGCAKIIETAHRDLIESGEYDFEKFSQYCSNIISSSVGSAAEYSKLSYMVDLHFSPSFLIHTYFARYFQRYFLQQRVRRTLIVTWSKLPNELQSILRPMMRVIGR